MRLILLTVLMGCGSDWTTADLDGDGITPAEGDCWDNAEGPDGSDLTGADVYPGAQETWYDAVDQDCDGRDDFDQDGDGYVPEEYQGRVTLNVAGSGGLPGGDCWDDPAATGVHAPLNGFNVLEAVTVFPGAVERYYDGIDQDCDGRDDFDKDGDGFNTADYEDAEGAFGEDCWDDTDIVPSSTNGWESDPDSDCEQPTPDAVNPEATECWYDGVDQDCSATSDFDQDGDGYDFADECDDLDPLVFPNDAPELWYNGVDENCDGSDGDKDFDLFVPDSYVQQMEADSIDWRAVNPGREAGDCWDALATETVPSDMVPLRGPPLGPEQVNPGADEGWYDAVDQDCDEGSDFDQDGDSYDTLHWPQRDNSVGPDCFDAEGDPITNPEGIDPEDVNPGVIENPYNGTDENCDGLDDYDADVDGFRSSTWGGTDCDDTEPEINPGMTETCATVGVDDNCINGDNDQNAVGCDDWFLDADGDTYGSTTSRCLCHADAASNYDASNNNDCDDTRSWVTPAGAEDCNTPQDDDCDTVTNEKDALNCDTLFYDADDDGYGTTASQCWCDESGNYRATNDDDCDDTRAAVKPSATETCTTAYDDDCDGSSNDPGASSCTSFYSDGDGDGYAGATSQCQCTAASPYTYTSTTDCNDGDDDINPGETENCSTGSDDNCNGSYNEQNAVDCDVFYYDADNDTYGVTGNSQCWCSETSYYRADVGGDCNDSTYSINPGVSENCSTGADDDCDSNANEKDALNCDWYEYDEDGDGYGLSGATSQCWCDPSSPYTGVAAAFDDCDDEDADRFPGNTDFGSPPGVEEDCDGYIDEDAVAYGDIVIHEMMVDPVGSEPDLEWFELHNQSGFTLFLDGWRFGDGSTSFCVSADAGLSVDADDLLVFCYGSSGSAPPGVTCDYVYGSNSFASFGTCSADAYYTLSNSGSETLEVELDGTTVDVVNYNGSTWGITGGSSVMLLTGGTADSNNSSTGWCNATKADTYDSTNGNFGTPGAANTCP